MSALGDAIDEARAEYAAAMSEFMPDTCTVRSAGEEATDDYGGSSGTPETIATGVPCAYRPLNAYERASGGGVTAHADYRIELPYVWEGASLQVGADHTIAVDARGPHPARTFTVTGPLYSSSEMKLTVAAKLEG